MRDPATVIPRAVRTALAAALVIYLAVGATLLLVLGPARLAGSTTPLADALPGYAPLVAGCLLLAASLPAVSVLTGVVVFAVGLVGRLAVTAWSSPG